MTPSNDASALPPVEKPEAAPDQHNDIEPGSVQQTAPVPAANGKTPKAAPVDKSDESSSKDKKKKGP